MNENLNNYKRYEELEIKQKELYRKALPSLEKADSLDRSIESVRALLNLYDIIQNQSMSFTLKYEEVEVTLLNLAYHYFLIENDFINALSVYDEMIKYNEKEGSTFISNSSIAYAHYNKYLINIILKRYPEANESFYSFIEFCRNKDITVEVSEIFKLSTHQGIKGFEFEEIDISENPVNEGGFNFEEELVVNLYINDNDMYFERKNHLFRLLLDSDLINVIDEYSSNFNISKETIRSLLYQLNDVDF